MKKSAAPAVLIGSTAFLLAAAGLHFSGSLAAKQKAPAPVIAETPAPAPAPPPPKVLTPAEIILQTPPADDTLSKAQREIATLAMKEPLWIPDFAPLVETARRKDSVIIPRIFTAIFGKPDSENVHTGTFLTGGLPPHESRPVTEYTYSGRLTNPTTGKKEDLTVKFISSRFAAATSASGHSCPP